MPITTRTIAGDLIAQFRLARGWTDRLCEPLQPEDFLLQPMPDASPAKWHLAHTTWFFEAFVLSGVIPEYRFAREDANFLFNSYYNAIGDRIARDKRGLLSRPSVEEVRRYRAEVDRRVVETLSDLSAEALDRVAPIVILGINHEQQHQELLLTDLKYAFGWNPTRPVYRSFGDDRTTAASMRWLEGRDGVQRIGFEGQGFSFDNESPRHRVFIEPHAIASRPATNGEFLAFMEGGGYDRPEFWLSDGWAAKIAGAWSSPLYWERRGAAWETFTLGGLKPLDASEPVVHISFYEADAFARWSGARLPTEAEWETMAADRPIAGDGGFLESGRNHPRVAPNLDESAAQVFGDVWEWTGSPYVAYPGYRPAAGALGEYNGKFMCNQMILRGGSCVTPKDHTRATYRNFFPPSARWQFSGVRLARDGG